MPNRAIRSRALSISDIPMSNPNDMVVEDEELMLSGSGEEECDCWDIPPPPEFHLPPPPEPPDFCSHPISPPSSFHTCDSIMPQEVDLEKSQPTVPVAVIVICAAVLGLTLTIASVFLFCRYRRKLRPSLPGKGSSEKINSLATSAVGLFYEDLNNSTPRPLPPSNQYCLSQIDHFTNPSVTGESRGASSSELSSFIRLAHVPSSSFDNQSGRISCSPVYEEVKTCSMLRIRGSPVGSRPRRNHWQQQQHQDHNQIDHPVPNIYQDTDSLRSSVLYCDPLLASDGSLNQQRPRRSYQGGSRLSGGSYEEPDFHEGLLRQMTSRRPPTSYSADMSEEDEDMALSRLGGPSKRNGMDLYVKPVERLRGASTDFDDSGQKETTDGAKQGKTEENCREDGDGKPTTSVTSLSFTAGSETIDQFRQRPTALDRVV
ncbi:unnamed protein product [Darwinula stevensoni]|uniref:Uncharacterized protein n=1 Tax=Darwinula stevensoni TaxID=69355 RepID=A0A7R8X6K8_9CRUS|nr:unnamed protein product [Darwinula stevensoni]CAG0885992.1 unnamed protein product [Darwinula stevensoni]